MSYWNSANTMSYSWVRHRPSRLHPIEVWRLLDSAIQTAPLPEPASNPKRFRRRVLGILPQDRAKADARANPEPSAPLVDSMEALLEGTELAEILVLSHLPDSRRRLRRQKTQSQQESTEPVNEKPVEILCKPRPGYMHGPRKIRIDGDVFAACFGYVIRRIARTRRD